MQLRLLTLNVWGFPAPVSRVPEARMRAIGERLPSLELDAAVFQEVWTASARAELIAAGKRAGLIHSWARHKTLQNSGLLILSRWPMRDIRFQLFALCGLPQRVNHADFYGGKGFVSAVLDTPEGEFQLMNTHLHAAYGSIGFADEYVGHRMAEAVELALEIALSPRPIALLGDLNSYHYRGELNVLRHTTGLVDVARAARNEQATIVPNSPFRPKENPPGPRIDYVLARSGKDMGLEPVSAMRVFDDNFDVDGELATYSDHAGVLGVLEFSGAGKPLRAPDPRNIARARRTLAYGQRIASARRRRQRTVAAGGLAVGLAGVSASRSRRGVLRALALAIAGTALIPSVATLALGEFFTPYELDKFADIERKLAQLESLEAGR